MARAFTTVCTWLRRAEGLTGRPRTLVAAFLSLAISSGCGVGVRESTILPHAECLRGSRRLRGCQQRSCLCNHRQTASAAQLSASTPRGRPKATTPGFRSLYGSKATAALKHRAIISQ
jgi:hypothetical protein